MERYRTAEVAELLCDFFRHRSIESVAWQAAKPEALKRRLYDILHGKTETVTLGVVDEIFVACGHTEWLQLLSPI